MSRLFCALLLLGAGAVHAQGWEDTFAGKALHPRWTWRAPVAGPTYSLQERPGWLRIRLPQREGGFNHWSEPAADNAPQLRTAVPEGDWELEAHIQLQQVAPANHFQAGLFAGVSDSLLLTLGALQGPTMEGGPKAPEAWLEPTGHSGFFRVPGEARDLRLRLARTGCIVRARISRDGNEWLDAGVYLLPQPRFAGILGKTFSDDPPIVFDVDYVRLTSVPRPVVRGRRALVGIGGEYPTGYRGLLARLGLPHEVLLDHQLVDLDLLRRFDLVAIGGMPAGVQDQAYDALVRYAREGGTALIDFRWTPPQALAASEKGDVNSLPDILVGGDDNPLAAWLAPKPRFKPGESRYYFQPASLAGCQVLARWEGHPQPGGAPRPAAGYTGSPAVWATPLGRGLMVYSTPAIGASLSWGPYHDALADALLQCLGGGRLEPQLVPEGARFARSQNALTEKVEVEGEPADENPGPPEFSRPRLSSKPGPLPPEARLVEEEPAPEFNLSGTYDARRGRARVLLNYWSRRLQVSVLFEPARAVLTRTEKGKTVATAALPLAGAQEVPFLIKERRDRILLLAGTRRAAISANRLWEGKLASAGAALSGLRYQPVEPALLSDDFARAEGEQGSWEAAAGKWSLRAVGDAKMGANPFTYSAKAGGVGLSAVGWPFWDDYAFDVSVRPTAGGVVGQAFYYQDDKNHLLFRARVCDTPRQEKDGFQVVRVAGGQETVLALKDGCLAKGHWYRLSVRARDGWVSAAVDGERVAAVEDRAFADGKVALYVREGEAEFDDVDVRPVAEAAAPGSVELDGAVPQFAGTLDRDTWAGTALQWRADAETPGLFWRGGVLYGDFALAFRCNFGDAAPAVVAQGPGGAAAPNPTAMTLLLAPDAGGPGSGYGLTLRPTGKAARAGAAGQTLAVELSRQGTAVGRATVTAGERPVLELRRTGDRLVALVDGRPVLQCPGGATPGQLSRLGFLARGFRPRLSGLRLRAGSVLDYCFDRAPTDWWVASGTWELASRWPCTPQWSWFAGESRRVAAVWHKRTLAGDVTLDLHVGPRTVQHSDGTNREICRAFNAVLCGDGQDVKSGYSFVAGADKNGAGATLSRNGQVVARNAAFRFYGDAHNQWINVRAEKRGARVALWVSDQQLISWEDPDPLPGGRVGIWTEDNAVMVPRATLYYREPSSPPQKALSSRQ